MVISRNIFTLYSGEILWNIKKDVTFALTSPKLEYMAASSAGCQDFDPTRYVSLS